MLSFADGLVEAVADGSHAAAEVAAELADSFFAVPLGYVGLFFVGFDADVDVLAAEVFLDGFCYVVAEFGCKVIEQFVVVGHYPVFGEGVISSPYKFLLTPASMMAVISGLSVSCTPQMGRAGKLAFLRLVVNWWYLR